MPLLLCFSSLPTPIYLCLASIAIQLQVLMPLLSLTDSKLNSLYYFTITYVRMRIMYIDSVVVVPDTLDRSEHKCPLCHTTTAPVAHKCMLLCYEPGGIYLLLMPYPSSCIISVD